MPPRTRRPRRSRLRLDRNSPSLCSCDQGDSISRTRIFAVSPFANRTCHSSVILWRSPSRILHELHRLRTAHEVKGVTTRFTIFTARNIITSDTRSRTRARRRRRRREAMSQLPSQPPPPPRQRRRGDAPAAMLILRDGVFHRKNRRGKRG